MVLTHVSFDHRRALALLDQAGFTRTQRRLLTAMVAATDTATGQVRLSQARLAEKADIPYRTAMRHIAAVRHLFREHKSGRQVIFTWDLCHCGVPTSICATCATPGYVPNGTPSLRPSLERLVSVEEKASTDDVPKRDQEGSALGNLNHDETHPGVSPAVAAESVSTTPTPEEQPSMSAIDRIRDLLGNVRRNGTSFLASCPVESHGNGNGDRNPSLSVTEKDGKVLIHCMSGCLVDDVLATLGLDFPDLWDEPLVREEKVAEYVYRNRSGDPYFIAERWQSSTGKRFVQRLPGADKPGLHGLQTTLYELPDVLAAAAAHLPIWVVEGEKCVRAMKTLGVVATTSPGGAAHWQDLYTERLLGASVVNIVADNDEPGRKHAAMVMASCKQKNIPVKVWQVAVPGEKVDIYDHVIAGKGIADLVPLRLNQTKPEGLTPATLLDTDYPPVTWVIPGMLPTGTAVLAGEPKAGKSLMAMDWGIGVASGQDTMHQVDTVPGSVLYLSLDNDSPRRLQRRYTVMANGRKRDLPIEFHTTWPTSSEAIAAVVEWAEIENDEGRVPRLVIADTLTMIEPCWENGPGGQTGYSHTVKVMKRWNQLAEDLDIAIAFVHHTRKSQQKEGGNWKERILGSQALPATINTILMIDTDSESNGTLHIAGRDVGAQDLQIQRDGLFWNCLERPHVDRPRFSVVPNP